MTMKPPKPEKIPKTDMMRHSHANFDIDAYIKKHKDEIYSRLILECISHTDFENKDEVEKLHLFLVSNPINSNVLILILSNFIYNDEVLKKIKTSNINTPNAKKDRKKKPDIDELIKFKDEYVFKKGHEYGWLKQAQRKFNLSNPTLNKILGKNN